ncbi:hypothetical protein NDI45_01765 [Leptolyngbya sp. GB1-A1]|uniref:hypothetical protein n=1 Tax=Leptolyngbya sp. GB1-A1 TaxID=2933908 RepID=UPI003296A793
MSPLKKVFDSGQITASGKLDRHDLNSHFYPEGSSRVESQGGTVEENGSGEQMGRLLFAEAKEAQLSALAAQQSFTKVYFFGGSNLFFRQTRNGEKLLNLRSTKVQAASSFL